jgi:glycolate oxidase FAD binding subunit
VTTVRSATALSEVNAVLADKTQMLPFDPPHCGADPTVDGMAPLACPAVVLNVIA